MLDTFENKLSVIHKSDRDDYILSGKLVEHCPAVDNAACDKYWDEFVQKHQGYFNGKLLGIKTISINGNEINFELFPREYKHFMYSQHVEKMEICNPLTVGIAFITSDNKIILGPRKGNRQAWQFAGGMFDPDRDIIDGKPDFIGTFECEVEEEVCKLDFYDYHYLGISRHNTGMFLTPDFMARVKQSSEYIFEEHKKAFASDFYEMPEIKAIEVSAENISRLLLNKMDMPLIGSNNTLMLLFARRLYGEDFYNEHIKQMPVTEDLIA